jgi:hypothetical protein
MSKMLCDRPHESVVDYDTARFVVSTGSGLSVNGTRLEMGDEVPSGALSAYALRCEYSRPPGRIETLEYALTDPDLREACARRGMDVDALTSTLAPPATPLSEAAQPSTRETLLLELDQKDRKELAELCEQSGLPTNGSRKQLRDRLAALLD